MDVITILDTHGVGNKVILYSRVNLNNIPALSTDVQVVDLYVLKFRRSLANSKRMGPVKIEYQFRTEPNTLPHKIIMLYKVVLALAFIE